MPALVRIAIFIAASVAILIGALFYSRTLKRDPAIADDPELNAIRTANPSLLVNRDNNRRLVYWFKEPSSGRQVPVPMDEATGARVRFVDCKPGDIPTPLLYPNRTATTCLEVRNDDHFLAAYYFDTADPVERIVDFFELNVEPEDRLKAFSRTRREERARRRKFSHEFIVFYSVQDGGGFIGYREEKNPVSPQ